MKMKTNTIHLKLETCINKMIVDTSIYKMPFYGYYNMLVNFKESDTIKTCGVNVTSSGMNFYYNSEFLDSLTQEEVNFIDLHELFHLLFNHSTRTINGKYDHYLANVAQDMIINSIIWSDINHGFVNIPKNDKGENTALFIPVEYKGIHVFEPLYNFLKKEQDRLKKQPKSSNKEEYGEFGKYDGGTVETFSLESILRNINDTKGEYTDQHIEDTIPEEFRDAIVEDAINKIKSKGLGSLDHIDSILGKLQKKRKDYLKEIKRSVTNLVGSGNKVKSITKLNRRNIKGIKGNKKNKSKLNVILDTSGSMSGLYEKVLSYIFRNDIEINLIQIDTKIKSINTIKNKKELSKLVITGGGGTVIMPAMDYVKDNLNSFPSIILTDGHTDTLDMSGIRHKVLVLSAGTECPIRNDNNRKVKQIIIEE
jgi:predicted metal-dependent peptidase